MIAAAKGEVRGSYEKGLNLCNYLDARYLPGRKNDLAFSNEGLLSTMGAVASCLLGVLAGLLLQAQSVSPARRVNYLLFSGLVSVGVGFLWGLELPIIYGRKIFLRL